MRKERREDERSEKRERALLMWNYKKTVFAWRKKKQKERIDKWVEAREKEQKEQRERQVQEKYE